MRTFISSHLSPLTSEVVGAPQMTLQQYLSTLPCLPLPSGNLQTEVIFPSLFLSSSPSCSFHCPYCRSFMTFQQNCRSVGRHSVSVKEEKKKKKQNKENLPGSATIRDRNCPSGGRAETSSPKGNARLPESNVPRSNVVNQGKSLESNKKHIHV